MRLIDADRFIEHLDNMAILDTLGFQPVMSINGIKECINLLPTVDAIPVKHAHWIFKDRSRGGFRRYTGIDNTGCEHTITVDERYHCKDPYCSNCGKLAGDVCQDYCCVCGAKMDEASVYEN